MTAHRDKLTAIVFMFFFKRLVRAAGKKVFLVLDNPRVPKRVP